MEKIIIKARAAFKGKAEGYALVCPDSIAGWDGINPLTGVIKDYHSINRGKSIRNTILVLPSSKGSNGWSCYFTASKITGGSPLGWLFTAMDSSAAVATAGLAIPTICDFSPEQDPCKLIKSGDYVYLDGDNGIAEIIKNPYPPTIISQDATSLQISGQYPDMREHYADFASQAQDVAKGLIKKVDNFKIKPEQIKSCQIKLATAAKEGELKAIFNEYLPQAELNIEIVSTLAEGALLCCTANCAL